MISAALVIPTHRHLRYTLAVQALLAITLVAGCNAKDSRDDQRIRQQAAQTTSDVKAGAKQAGNQIKEGAVKAERTLDDVAAGVKDGLKTPATDDLTAAVDINSATETRLTNLPGVGPSEAKKIIRNRPYDRAYDLVKKGVMDEDAFAKVSSRIVVR